MLTRTDRRRFPVLLILIAALALFLAGAPVQAQEGSAPDAPTGLTVASVSHDSVELDWDDSGDSSITHYQVFRRDRALHDAGEFVIIEGDTGSTATEYTDATVEADEEYVYRVKAVNAYGASPWSDHVRADTPTGPGQETVYTYEDGDRTIQVILQGDLVVQETGADTPSDDVVRRTAGGNIVRKQSGDGGADLPVFRSALGGALMTLPGGVMLALDPDWDEAMVNGFFARNNISKGRISELDYIPNGFFVQTEPGFPSLELANALAAQKGVLLSSPNWWREVEAKQAPEEPKGDDREGTQEARGIEPRNEDFSEAYDLPLGGDSEGWISPANDIDYFKLDLSDQPGDTDVLIYTTDRTSDSVDTVGKLYDADEVLLQENDDGGTGNHFRMLERLSSDVYYVTVEGYASATGSYTLYAKPVLSPGSSVEMSIGSSGEVHGYILDLTGESGATDVSLFAVSDNVLLGGFDRLGNTDASGNRRVLHHWHASLTGGSTYTFAIESDSDAEESGRTGDYSVHFATVPDQSLRIGAATTLSLDAPTSGKLSSGSAAHYFKLVLDEPKDLVIMTFWDAQTVIVDSTDTEIPVNDLYSRISDDFAAGTYYVKITAPDASSSSPVRYALYAYEDTGYRTWVDGCADTTNDLGSSINDPLYACQWHLNSADSAGMDINVESVWADGITGAGVNVAVVDYTIDYSHDDLSPNINTALNHDYGGRGNTYRPADHHGTNVAGVIAARDNNIGVRGVALRATIYGYNLLADGGTYYTDDRNKADAMTRNRVATAVSNNSWGPVDGYGLDLAPEEWEMAIDSGLTDGYAGKGVFYAWAGGNGHEVGDDSNLDEYANYYGVTAVCAVGDNGIRSSYSEKGANLWVCAPSSGGDRGIVTTENSDRYINTFNGTSAATPKVSGVAALLRHANSDLTWRDLKLILAASARQNDVSNAGWEEGARKYGSTDDSNRYHFNHEYGFGVVDAAAAVALAQDWRNVPEFQDESLASPTINRSIPNNMPSGITSSLSLNTEIDFTEFVEVTVTIDHPSWRELRIELVSPAGIVSELAVPMNRSDLNSGILTPWSTLLPGTFRFGSAKHLGEDPSGTWRLQVSDEFYGGFSNRGDLVRWSIKVYGHGGNSVSAVSTGRTTATATVELNNPDSESLTVHLRYSGNDGSTWSTLVMQTTTGTSVDSPLTGLAPNAEYVLEASLDSTFSDGNEVTANFVNRPANQDIDTLAAAGNTSPYGLWSNGMTIWVVNTGTSDKIYAYTLATGARDSDKDIDTLTAAGNTRPIGLWSDGTTMWVVDVGEEKLYAYTLATGTWNPDKDIDTLAAAGNTIPLGLWSNGTTIWVVNTVRGTSAKIYAYTLANGARDSDKDIDTLTAAGNLHASGLWSDDTTIWVADFGDDKIYAYTLANGARDSDKDIDTLTAAGITAPVGLWSDDATIWVADQVNDKLYAYYIEVSTRTPVNTAPDLVVVSPSASPSSPLTGASFTLRATVSNRGGSTAGSTTLTYYRSTNDTISTSDISVGTDDVGALDAGASSAQSTSVTAPSSAGTYYYGACVGTVTNESNTTNNCSGAVRVTVPEPKSDEDYDHDDDGLIEVANLAQLNAIRWDQDGDGSVSSSDAADYGTAFPNALAGMGCPASGCIGYELTGDLNFDTNGNGSPDAGDTYWNGGKGWDNFGLSATFEGNSNVLSHLFIDRPGELSLGLFGSVNRGAEIRNVGLEGISVSGGRVSIGGLAGFNIGSISASYATGVVSGGDGVGSIGGLVGQHLGSISASYATSAVNGGSNSRYIGGLVGQNSAEGWISASYATGAVTGESNSSVIGGLVGANHGVSISASYATGSVTGGSNSSNIGGLVGENAFDGSISASYATGSVTGGSNSRYIGGLVGANSAEGWISASYATSAVSGGSNSRYIGGLVGSGSGSATSASYWDTLTSGQTTSRAGVGKTSSELRSPTDYTGIYADWNLDLDGDGAADDPWDFGTSCQYPVLTANAPINNAVAPDLVMNAPTVSDSSPVAGTSFTLSATVCNQGNEAAGSSTLHYYRSADSTISSSDTFVGTDSVSGLSAGASGAEFISLTAPATLRTYYYGACVDAVANESDTGNNCSDAVAVNVVGQSDLVVNATTVSDSSPLAGASFTLSTRVLNQGNEAAGSSILRYYRSNDDAIDTSDTSVGMDPVSGLGSSVSGIQSISLTAPATVGTYYYGACVDAVANESDTTNNCSAGVGVTVVGRPDLVVGTPTVSDDSLTAGATFTLRATVRNRGGGAAAATTLTYYHSTDDTISTSDTVVRMGAVVPSLSAGASSAQSTSVTAPSRARTYYYGACVDAVANESNTTNNCSAAVEVTVLQANAAPVFRSSPTISVAENQTSAGMVRATDSDNEDSIEGYAISGGADWRLFSIVETSGVLTFDAAPNYEDAQDQGTNNTYVVVVRATSGTETRVKTATLTITVTVTDVSGEAPRRPGAPSVSAASAASATSLSVNWSAPDNEGPPITDYDVQYREDNGGGWSDASHTGTARATTLTGLTEDTSYQVQVRATNAEGAGSWSDSGSGRTDANAAPVFTSSATFSAAENQTAVGTVRATDADDNITGYAITGGADRSFFSIRETSGALTFRTEPNYEAAQDQGGNNTYVVEVTATSGTGPREKTATQTITVTVTDVNGEAPGRPGTPSVSAASATSLRVSWAAPDNAGPAITDYDYRHRTTSPQGSWTEVTGTTITRLSATIGSLTENTSYDVQVRATNDEGTGSWSTSGSGTTDANAAPVFSSLSTFNAAENQTSVGTVRAMDFDNEDSIEGYAISDGADRRFFSIGATSGALTFRTEPNYEAAQDQGRNNTYMVVVRATSGTGTREKTATQTITVRVTDVNTEAPGRPGTPSVSAASATSLSVNWSAPSNAGPAITDYDYRYRTTSPQGSWTEVTGTTITTLSATIGSLTENTSYDVQVRAKNDEGTGAWSDSGSGTTDANAAPSFTSSATFSVAENQTRVGTVQATDADDNITGYAITGGEDQSFFSIGVTSGVLTFETAPNYEDAQDQNGDNTYMVEVTATSGTGTREKTATQTITVTVTMAAAPDLVVDEPRVTDSSPLTGASFTLRATVRNRGSAAAGNTILRYYRSTDSTISSSDTPAGTDPVPSLRAGNTSDESTGVTAPSTAGTYYYYACVDTVTNESNTANNCSTVVEVTVVAPPDLVVVRSDVNNNNPAAAADLTLSATVRNAGGSTAAATTLTYYRSTDSTISSIDTPEGTVTVSSLSAEATSAQFITVTAPSTPRTYYYGACVEPVQNESDTTNNCSVAVAVTVGTAPAPDLVVESPSVDDSSPLTGDPFTLSVTVRNQGSAAADNSTLRYRRSIDSTISPDDTLEPSRSAVIGLRPGGTVTQQMPLDAPFTAGTYYYYACVEAVPDESNTENNCSAGVPVTVGAAPVFSEGGSTERSVAENSAAGANVGSAVRATDADNDTLTYSLEGTDEASFSIVSARGQIRTVAALDHETRSSYSVTVKADDGKGGTATIEVIITVTDVNEPPTVNGENLVTIFENEDLIASYSAIDPEGPATTFTWSVTGTDRGDFNINRNTGDLTFRNTPDFERPADSDRNNMYEVTVRAYDGRYYGSFDVTVTVEDVNEPPTITTTSSSATELRQNENVTSRLYTYRATDPERETITWSVEGADKGFFIIDQSGQFSFASAPNFEEPGGSGRDNVYNVVVQATDDDSNTAPLDVAVTVIDVNEGPEVSLVGSAPGSVPENTPVTKVLATYTAIDPEQPGETITRWSVTGRDGGDFVINALGELRFRNTPDFERPADSNRDSVYEVTVRAYDGRYYGSLDVTVTVKDENEPPTITTTSSSATELRQNENVTSRLYTYRATDPEGADTVTWSVEGVDARFFDIDEGGQFSFKEDSPPDFEDPADSDQDNVYNVEIQAEDSGGIEASLPVMVTVRDVNEGPEVTSGESSFTISENQDLPNAVYAGFDPEGGTVTRWTVGGTDGGDFTISQEGVLTFRSIPDFERPADSNRNNIYELQVRPYDGRYYGSFDVTVTVNDVNEPPAITTTSNSATALRQNENATSLLYTYRATDPEGADTVTWSVEGVDARFFDIDEGGQFSFKEDSPPDFEDPADSDQDNVYNVEIQAEDSGGIEASLPVTVTVANDAEGVEPTITTRRPPPTYRENDTRTVYTFRASDPQRDTITWTLDGTDAEDFTIDRDTGVLTFAISPDFEIPVDADENNDYELTVIATDEDDHVDRLSFTITVTEVDEGPEVSGPLTFSINENGSLPNAVYTAEDPEGSNVARWSVGGRDGGDFFITQGGTLYFRSPPDYERPADSDRDNVYEVTIQPSDGRNNGAYPVTVTVTNVNEAPTITTTSRTAFSQPENRTSTLYTFRATDPEGGTVTWLAAGPDGSLFIIDEGGRFSFREDDPPDFDAPSDVGEDNVYNVTIEARDPESKTASLPVAVTVTEVNEGPVITRDGNLFGNPPGSVPENQSVTQVLATYTARDPERPGVKITRWSTAGRDGGDFVINALGQLRFRNPPDHERPADSNRDNVYEVEIRASDGRNTSALAEVQRVTVTGVDEAPTITTTSRTAFSQQEGQTSTLHTFRATDPEGGTVTWAAGGTDGRAFTITTDSSGRGSLSFANPPDYESPTDSGGDNVYEVTVQASDDSAPANTDSLEVVVTVTDHNEGEEPTISTRRPPATYRENGTSAVYTFRASDPQRDTIRWTLEGADSGDFTITPDSSGRGVLTFNNLPDFESPADGDLDNTYELAVVAADGDGNSDQVEFTITVTDHNEGEEPTISTRRPPATYRENDTRTVYTFRATDPQRDTIIWTLEGTDRGDFTIDRDTGALTFATSPDFEIPADADRNNEYELAVVATDDDGNTDRLDFTITVTDVNEGPVITLDGNLFGSPSGSVLENTPDTQVLADYTARDPEDSTANIFRWSTAGRDGGDFVISDLGELRFRSSPDYERPADSDRNNVYEVTVRAYDGRVYGDHDVKVTVIPLNEAPVITTKSRTEFTLRENFTAVLYTYRATDQDEDDAVTWSVEGDDGEDFAIYNGILNFRLLPDLENPADEDGDNVYEITVVAADRAGLRDTVDAVITITDQSEGPVIAGPISYTVAESYDIAGVLGSYTATDAKDNRPVHPRWSLSGRDGGDFTINEDGELTFRNIPDYDRPADANRDSVYEVTVRGHDSRAYGNLNVTVTVTDVNEHDPVVTGRETLSFRENTAVETRLHTYRATDGDRDTSFIWSLEGDDEDDFAIDQGGVLTFSAPPDYEGPADKDNDSVYRVTVVASDDGAKRGTLGVTVTVTEQNEGPVVSGTDEFTINENQDLAQNQRGFSTTYTATDPEAVGGVATTIRWSVSGRDGGDFTIHRDTGVLTFRTPPDHERPADADRNNVYEVTVRAHDGRNYGDFQVTVTVEDVPEITGLAVITWTENLEGVLATYRHAGQGDLNVDPSWRLTGADSGDFTIDRETGNLTFRSTPDHERPADSNRDNVYSFTVQVSDGSYHGTLDVTVTVNAVNEPPAVTGRDNLSFRENTPVTTRLHTYRATDPEGDAFEWSLGGLDKDDFNITTDSNGRGVLTFSSPPNFDIPSGSGAHFNEYLVTVVASDGTNRGTLDVTVTVTDQNEGAVVTGDQTIAVREDQDPAVTLATYSATDPEGQRITRWSLSGSDGGDFLISANGDLAFRNTPDYDRPADSNRDNEYLVTVRAYDGRTYGNLDVIITVSNVNDHAPVIREGSRTSFTYREEGTAALYTYRATDGDKDDVIMWTTGGADGGDFTIDRDTGELTFGEPPDYEAPGDSDQNNVYELTVVATDTGRRKASLGVTVTVTEVDEGPEISGANTYTVPEGQDLTGATFNARDPEDTSAAVTRWSLSGRDAGDFTITDTRPNSARLAFRNTPDYDRPADSNRDNEYQVTVRAYNGSTYGSLDVTVTVTPVNEDDPAVTGRETLSARENTATTTRLHTYRATDGDRNTEIIWSVEGDDGDYFAIDEGVLTFSAPPDYEGRTDSDGDNVYEIMVVASDGANRGTLGVTVTVTDVNEGPVIEVTNTNTDITVDENNDQVLATYAATDPEDPGLKITRWSVTGRDGGDFTINEDGELTFRNPPDHERAADSGGDNVYEVTVRASDGRVYGAHDVTVTVKPVDEAPEFRKGSKDSFSYRENGGAALYTYRATDPEGAEVTWSVSGGDAGRFVIGSETGVLTFREPPDFDIPSGSGTHHNEYLVTVVATDQTGRAASLPVTVTVTDVNEGPEITEIGTNTAITVPENYDQVLATYSATDPEDQPVTRWSVTGRDGGDFTINDGGELTFRNPPDSERPADANRDSVYEVTVRASDGRHYGTLDVVVTVEAVDEAPEFQRNTQDSFVYPENGASAIYTYRATDPEGSDVTWGLSETDSGAFSIGKAGVLTFNSSPDYEAPTDSDRNNVYELTVEASDGNNTNPLDVTVTVTNLTDARAVIRGTAQVGRTLTAETSGIPDEDRRDRVDFSYQWLADDKDIESATDSTYEITEKDEGKAIKVRVTFTDNAGREETLTSAATAPVKPAQSNEPAAGLPAINGTAQVGETLTADTSGVADADGLSNVQYEYQWLADDSDIAGATNATYTLTDSEESKAITVQVRFTDDADNEEMLTSTATDAVAARPAQLTATFPASPFQSSRHKGDDDRPQVIVAFNLPVQSFDETTPSVSLTGATVSSLVRHEEDGLENAWVFFLDPEGNDDVVFTLVAGQSCDGGGICTGEGKMLSEGGTTTLPGPDEEDKPDNTDSNEPNSPATGAPTITGTAQVGETLEAGTSGITDADGLSDVQYEYQWLADGTDISGATNATYTLAAADEGKAIKVQVSFTDDAGNEETLTSAATDVVEAAPTTNSPATGAPTISGTAQVGETLTANTSGVADVDGLSNVQYEYQWLADDSDISGATNATYTLTDSEESKAITVQVSFTDDADNDETLTSAATDAVAGAQPTEPPDQPSGLSATASHDSVTLTWDDPGDDSITGYVILRRIPGVDPEGQFDELVADTGTAATTYTDDTVSAETRYTYRIKAINEHGTSERSRWFHIDTPAAPAPEEEQADEPPAKATGLSSEVSHNMVILTWDDPNDDSITGYLILRRDKDIHEEGTFLTVAPDTGSSETTYIDASVEPERRYVYRIKAINASGVSEISSWVRAYTPAVPDPAPEAPAKPTSLSATFSHDSVTLTWDDPGDDSITGYVILRRDKDLQPEEGTFFTVTSDTGFAETTYTDDTAEPDKRYVYRIKAINEHGEMSEISSWVRAYTPAAP